MNSAAVSQMVLFFLLSGGTAPCASNPAAVTLVNASTPYSAGAASDAEISAIERLNSAPTGHSPQTDLSKSDSTKPRVRGFPANDRLEVLPGGEFRLGQEVEIPLRINGGGLTTLETMQTQYFEENGNTPDLVSGSKHFVPILHRPDGSPYVKIVPMRLGKLELTLDGVFPDGGSVLKRVMVKVEPSQNATAKLIVGPKRDIKRVHMSMTGDDKRGALEVYAKYDGIDPLLKIDPAFATYRIVNWEGRTVPVQLDDQTGRLTSIHPGQALVETGFGGRRNLTCVDVEQVLNPSGSYYGKDCRQLLSPGEKLGAQE